MSIENLPLRIQEKMIRVSTHGEFTKEGEVVYHEKDIIKIMDEEFKRDWILAKKESPNREDRNYIFCLISLRNGLVREAMYSVEEKHYMTQDKTNLTRNVIAWRYLPEAYSQEE